MHTLPGAWCTLVHHGAHLLGPPEVGEEGGGGGGGGGGGEEARRGHLHTTGEVLEELEVLEAGFRSILVWCDGISQF